MRKHTKPATTTRRASRAGLLAACLALFALALPATGAQAAKIVTDTFVPPPSGASHNPGPKGVAVNDSSTADPADGRIYVSDRNRVVAFDSDLNFELAFGRDAVSPGGTGNVANNETQELAINASEGSYTLRFGSATNTTPPLDWDADAPTVQAALNALPSISAGGGSVSVSGTNPFTIEFDAGPLADADVSQLAVDSSALAAPVGDTHSCAGSASGATGFEFQWLRNGAEILGATADTYTTVGADAGTVLQCRVRGFNAVAGNVGVSDPIVIAPYPATAPPVRTSSGSLTGPFPEVGGGGGEVLSCSAGSWTGADSFAFQWYRNGIPLSGNGADTDTYTVQPADVASAATFACSVTATNAGGSVTRTAGNSRSTSPAPPPLNIPSANVARLGIAQTTVIGANSFEVCTVEAECKPGLVGGFGGAMSISSNTPHALAIDQSDGSVYVADRGNDRIQKFDADGAFLWAAGKGVNVSTPGDVCPAGDQCQAGESDGAEAGFSVIGGIAVNQADGNLYVLDRDNNRVQVLAPDGSFEFMWGIDVAGGGVPETCDSGCQPGDSQSDVLGGFVSPTDIAVGDGGRVYVTQGAALASNKRLQVFNDPESDPTDAFFFGTDYFVGQHTDPDTAELIRPDAPTLLAIDTGPTSAAADDVLYVVNHPAFPGFVRPHVVLEFNAGTEALLDTHGVGEDFDRGFGLAHDPDHGVAGDRLFWAGPTNSGGAAQRDVVAVLEDAAPPDPPEPLIDPVTVFDDTTATLEGTVDPNNNPTSYRFEYIEDAAYQANGETFAGALTAPPVTDAEAGSGDAAVAVSEDIADLNPGTLYHARLLARVTGGPNNGTEVASAEVEFTTDAGAPTASTAPVSAKTASALLSGIVDPHGTETTYAFEYGTQGPCSNPANACDSTPLTSAGAAGGEKVVSEQVTGLDPNATYHYRLVVSSVLGEASTPDRTLVTIPQSSLPENRAYEKATPDEKGDAELGTNRRQASASGDALTHTPPLGTAFPGGNSSQGLTNPYLSTRAPDGSWTTKALAPPFSPHGLDFKYKVIGYSEDLSKQLSWLSNATGIAGDGEGGYVRDNAIDAFTDLPGMSSGLSNTQLQGVWIWNPQMEHLAVDAAEPITPETPLDGSNYLHLWSAADGAELISRLPGGQIVPVGITTYLDNRVSVGGERVFWESNTPLDDGRPLYAYDAGATVEVSATERVPADPAGTGSATFAGASLDGEVVLFTSEEKLTDDATATSGGEGGELYRYDFSAPAGERLTDLTPAPAAPGGAEVRSVVDVSDDGDRVYFVAFARLAPGGVAGKNNLYLSDSSGGAPVTTHVATLDPEADTDANFNTPADLETIQGRGNRNGSRSPLASADGGRLLFRSGVRLTASPNGGLPQAYLYDASADRLECVSCPPAGGGQVSETRLGIRHIPPIVGQGLELHQLRNLSADGSRAFFQTATPLLPTDSNGKVDVYEWRQGQLHLISSGRHPGDSTFVDASEDGDSAFFATRERLVSTDTDSFMDAYVARVDGISPAAPAEPPLCEGDSCFPLPEEPEDPTPATSNALPSGNLQQQSSSGNLRRCLRPARTAKRHSDRAKRARRGLRRAARASNDRRVVRLRRAARRHARAAKQNANRAKRCRRAVRAQANADRRADR